MSKARKAFYILAAIFFAIFIVGAVFFGVNFQAIEAGRLAGETAEEFYPVLGCVVALIPVSIAMICVYWKYLAFEGLF